MWDTVYSRGILEKLSEDGKRTSNIVCWSTNNFWVRVLSALECELMEHIGTRIHRDEPFNNPLSSALDKQWVWNRVAKYYKDAECGCYLFKIYFDQLDIDVNLWVNQNTIAEYCVELQNNPLDFYASILAHSIKSEWEEKPLYFCAIISLYKDRFREIYGFDYEDFEIPFDAIYNSPQAA